MNRFDVIIVGAGSAGCVLASRLSEDPNKRVLLLEAGGSGRSMNVRIPAAFTKLFKTERDWAYYTEPQAGLDGRSLFWPRGKMLGGCSSMNAQIWTRGHAADYATWAASTGPRFDPSEVQRAYRKAERRDSEHYGREGPQRIEDLRDPSVTSRAFLEACRAQGYPELRDHNQPHDGGFALSQVTQRRGKRMSAADAYLTPARRRPNLTVVTCAHVRRVLFDGRRAVGVESATARGVVQRYYGAEVVLSAGAVGSPQLLMLSGVGPAAELAQHGITRVVDSAEVGENLQDHLLTCLVVRGLKPISLVGAERLPELFKYLLLKRGMLTSPVAEALAFVKTDRALPAPDVELIWAPAPFVDHGLVPQAEHGFTVGVVLLTPESRGVIRLRTADARDAPRIDPRYLTDARGRDLATCCAGLALGQNLLRAAALEPYVGAYVEPAYAADTAADRARFVREQAETIYHPVGTCRMGSDRGSVVDAELRVRGAEGLSVIDASVMPSIPRGHTQAPTVMLAELGAELLHERLGARRHGPAAAGMAASPSSVG